MSTIRPGQRAALVVADLNDTMTWLRYPGRRSHTASAEDMVFSLS
jgi:hypothetical protein